MLFKEYILVMTLSYSPTVFYHILNVFKWVFMHICLLLSYKIKRMCSHSVVSDSVTPWPVAYQAPPSMGFSRQEYWSGVPFLSPNDLPNPGIKPKSPAL